MHPANSVAFMQPEALEAAIASREEKLHPQLRGSLLFAGGRVLSNASAPTNSESQAQAQSQSQSESESETEAEAEAEAESESLEDQATIVIDDDDNEVHEPTAWCACDVGCTKILWQVSSHSEQCVLYADCHPSAQSV